MWVKQGIKKKGLHGLCILVGVVFQPELLGQSQSIEPSRPKPLEKWSPESADSLEPGSVLPEHPEAREIVPLAPSKPVTGPIFGNSPIRVPVVDEPPVGVSSAQDLQPLLEQTLHPVVVAAERFYSITTDEVLLRRGPGPDFPAFGSLLQGDTVVHLDTDDDWNRVRIASGTDGWVFSDFCRPKPESLAVITTERLNLRQAPALDALVLGTLYQGAIVLADPGEAEWTKIRTPNLETAFVASEYLAELSGPEELPYPARPYPGRTENTATLAVTGRPATGEVEYFLGVRGDEWVKGGKVGLIYMSPHGPNPLVDERFEPPKFLDGTFFQKAIGRDEFSLALPSGFEFPQEVETVVVGYLRGEKKDPFWVFRFAFAHGDDEGRFALVRQEGDQAGSFFFLEVKQLE